MPNLKELAEAAQTMPWDKSSSDVPYAARAAFKEAITADLFLEMLEALESTAHLLMAVGMVIEHDKSRAHAIKTAENARAVIAKASALPS